MGGHDVLRRDIQKAPEYKSLREIGLMREAGKLVARALRICREMAKPGARTADINQAVENLFASHGATPLFKGYAPGGINTPFPAVTCLSLNEQVVHGIPGGRILRDGDLLKVDTACRLNGWCADAAITIPIGVVRAERLRLVKVAEETLRVAIEEMGRRRWWSEVAARMQRHVQEAGFSVVEQYVGHGIGRDMHESPQVPNFVNRDLQKRGDFRLEPGLVLAVEPMVNMGRQDVRVLDDQWTVVTQDGLPSVHVEHTLAVTPSGVVVVTADDDDPAGKVRMSEAATA
ncbi:MAG TPA: type I methionyl aminopeptidase [Gemmataceae bacterium]|nr:type I methionyl aminopeptidase [Gemmataceae bacterium]